MEQLLKAAYTCVFEEQITGLVKLGVCARREFDTYTKYSRSGTDVLSWSIKMKLLIFCTNPSICTGGVLLKISLTVYSQSHEPTGCETNMAWATKIMTQLGT